MICIVAVDRNWSIGKDGRLLVHIPRDLQYFKERTYGKTVIMGRKTLESLPKKEPLKGRKNIVLTRNPDYRVEGAQVVHSIEEALELVSGSAPEDVFVIGGGSVYKGMLPHCDRAYITRIEYAYDSDTFFPNLDAAPDWELESEGEEQTLFDLIYHFDIYRRV